VYSLNHVAVSAWILTLILKNNFDTYSVVEKIIVWLIKEIDMLRYEAKDLKCLIEDFPIQNANRREVIWVLFWLLINSIYKNDPNLGNFNVNYVSSSWKILDSNLFMECCKLIEERSDKNFETHDQVLWDTVHLLGCCLNDLPAQVPKIIDTGFPEKLIESVYNFAPKNIYSQMLRFIQYI